VSYIVHFGKHSGKSLEEVPSDYLGWVVREQVQCWELFEAELKRRRQAKRKPPPTPNPRIHSHALLRANQRLKENYEAYGLPGETIGNYLIRIFKWVKKFGKSYPHKDGRTLHIAHAKNGDCWHFVTAKKDKRDLIITVINKDK
jgi:hypothetical protein